MRLTLGALPLLLLSCTANITGPDGKNAVGPDSSGLTPGGPGTGGSGGAGALPQNCPSGPAQPEITARIRRLTRLELENTLADLLGDKTRALAGDIEADTFAIGYSTGDERGVSSNYVDALKSIAERASAQLAAAPEQRAIDAKCKADAASAQACAQDFIDTFGARALRRPLTDDERSGLLDVYVAGTATVAAGDAGAALDAGLTYAVRALLQSSSFIFRTELGEQGAPGAPGSELALTPYEAAAALSYALIASPPDAELTQKAATGELLTAEQLSAAGRRLLEGHPERFARQAERFVREWLTIDVSSPVWKKDGTLYPEATGAYKAAVDKEAELFLRDWAQAPSFKALLTTNRSFVSKDNAAAYGLDVTSTDFMPTELDPSQRAGVLTLPSYLGSRAHTDSSSPVLRGTAVMRKFLCREPPPVPAMVPPLPPADKSGAQTTRERFEMHTAIAFCSACHQSFDPMGYAFEHYDAMGRYRTQENGVDVDSSGALVGSAGSDAPVADAVALASLLARAPDVQACFVRQTYRFTVGRKETDADACAIRDYAQLFADKQLDLRELMLALVTNPAALKRAAITPAP